MSKEIKLSLTIVEFLELYTALNEKIVDKMSPLDRGELEYIKFLADIQGKLLEQAR